MKISNLAHYQIYVKHSESVNDPDTFDDIEMGLPPMFKAQNEWKWDQWYDVKNKIRLQVPLCNLSEISRWSCLTFLGKLLQKLQAHGERKNCLEGKHYCEVPLPKRGRLERGHISIVVGAKQAADCGYDTKESVHFAIFANNVPRPVLVDI